MTFYRLICAAGLAALSSFAFAGDTQPDRVLELFTSQGCSSCPPANEFAAQMSEDPETLVLSYGVTYWDYLGWKDTFAAPEFTKRQRDYGKAFGSANVYTPQMILNGSAHGSRYTARDVTSMSLPAKQADIQFFKEGDVLKAKMTAEQAPYAYEAVIVEYIAGPQSVPVKAGENRGRVLTLNNVVSNVTPLGLWKNADLLETGVIPQSGKSYALLLHDTESKALLNAARLSE